MKSRRRYLTPKQKAELIRQQNFLCRCGCKEPLGTDPREIEFDHMHDLQFGGGNEWENWAALWWENRYIILSALRARQAIREAVAEEREAMAVMAEKWDPGRGGGGNRR